MVAYSWPWGDTWLIAGVTLLAVLAVAAGGFLGWRRADKYDKDLWGIWTVIVAVVVLVVGAAVVVASGLANINEQKKTARGLGDGPRPAAGVIDGRPVDGITEMADNFPNVATKCVWDGWRVFVTSNGDHLFVVPDEKCRHKNTGPSD